ncbi:hypothetical protein NIE88_21395 [Sporolactobacillus shoreicorticis]|uniref:Transposase n=1 Tax=Sporolactobacillus shoreicorticis TaxID=1923877 RepID=A0ABW5S5P4_9BACL|nr:hypothetical protein [Sporolactobacillus shoreicorticis]MCO7128285.1 hypothetical protein [Sporolactobacillus shoreicorticis]
MIWLQHLLLELEKHNEKLEKEVDPFMQNDQEEVSLLKTIPGMNRNAASVIPTDVYLPSCGGLNARKKRSSKTAGALAHVILKIEPGSDYLLKRKQSASIKR